METQRFLYLLSGTIIILTLILLGEGLYLSAQRKDIAVESALVLSPSPAVSPTNSPEPIVLTWKSYENSTYHFTMQVPADWKMQDFTAFYKNGGTLIAFSPNDLPCGSCAYFQDGYFSLKIFNPTTDPIAYGDFQERMKAMGKKQGYQGVKIDGITGVMFLNTVAFEHEGWIYEFALDENKGQTKITDSETFQKSVSSFQFTSLKFGN